MLGGNGSGGGGDNDNDTGNDDKPTALFSRMKSSSSHDELNGDATTNTNHHQNEAVNPFGDLDQMDAADPLQEPLLPVEDPKEWKNLTRGGKKE